MHTVNTHREVFEARNIPAPISGIRLFSVFSRWTDKEWHHSNFLPDASVRDKEAWLDAMLRSNKKVVDVEAYLVVLNALADPAETTDAGLPRRAERWMNCLIDHLGTPTSECYQAVIQSWANSSKEQILVIVNRAERWLNDLVAESEKYPDRIQPTIECYNAFLDACTRGRSAKNKKGRMIMTRNVQTADSILRRLHSHHHHMGGDTHLSPNTETFNFVIRGWSRLKQNDLMAERVLSLLRLMESYQRSNPRASEVRPNSKSYTMAIDALVSVAKLKASRCAKQADAFNQDPSMNGLDEIKQAEGILTYMHSLYDAGVQGVIPHTVPYNVFIGGWAGLAGFKHQEAPLKAEEVLRKMLSHKDKGFTDAAPDRISFEKVMLAWANSHHPNAGKRVVWWLKKLRNDSELDSDDKLLPTTQTYNIAMKALAASEGALATENFLCDLGDKYKEERTRSICPNSESFSIVIRAWLQKADNDSNLHERVRSLRRAVEWLSSLLEVENEENLATSPELFLRVLKVAKTCASNRSDILELATSTFHDLKKSRHQVSYIAYSNLLQVGLMALSEPSDDVARTEFVENLFKECCEDGLMSHLFVQALVTSPKYATGWTTKESKILKEQLFENWPHPISWSRNLPNEKTRAKSSDAIRHPKPHRKNAPKR